MAKNIEHIVHKNSSSVVNNEPKLPTSLQIEYGEIAVNYSAGNETISLKNSDNQIVTFSSDNKFVKAEVLDKKEQVIASALNDLNERNNEIVEQLNEFKSDVSDNQSDINSSLNDLDTRLSSVEDIGDELIDRIDEIGQDIEDNEKVTGAALNDLNSRINALGQGSNDLEQVIIDNEEVTALALNDLNTRLNGINEVIEDNEKVTSAALNYLNESVEDINADLSSMSDTVEELDTYAPYAGSATNGGAAKKTASIPYAQVDSTSTSTAFTATVPGITELTDGTCVLLKNGVITSASGFTININGLGAKPSFSNMTSATQDTTVFNVNYTMLFIYDSNRVVGGVTGAWCCYRGYDSNTDTVGYSLRTNSSTLKAKFKTYRYRLLFTSADNNYWVGANASTSTDATTSRTPTTEKINPFGPIVYYGNTTVINANATFGASYLWEQYIFNLGYSFNNTGAALTLTYPAPVYIKCTPQTDGSVIIDATNPYVQTLPSTEDGKIYIFLGIAYSETNVELRAWHPVYYYKDGCIRLWTNAPSGLPAVTSSDNGKILMVVNGAWAMVNPTTIYTGSGTPSSSQGNNGDIYLQTS